MGKLRTHADRAALFELTKRASKFLSLVLDVHLKDAVNVTVALTLCSVVVPLPLPPGTVTESEVQYPADGTAAGLRFLRPVSRPVQ